MSNTTVATVGDAAGDGICSITEAAIPMTGVPVPIGSDPIRAHGRETFTR